MLSVSSFSSSHLGLTIFLAIDCYSKYFFLKHFFLISLSLASKESVLILFVITIEQILNKHWMVFQSCSTPLVFKLHSHSSLCFYLYLVLIKSGIWEHFGQLYCDWHPKGISWVYLHCNKCLKTDTTINLHKTHCHVAVLNYLCLVYSPLTLWKSYTTIWYKVFLWYELLHWEVRFKYFFPKYSSMCFLFSPSECFIYAYKILCMWNYIIYWTYIHFCITDSYFVDQNNTQMFHILPEI